MIRDFLIKAYRFMGRDYVKDGQGTNVPKILVAYLSEPFFKRNDKRYMGLHQNRRETLMMSEVLDDMKFAYRFTNFQKPNLNPQGYDVVFGLEPVIDRCVKYNPKAVKIYYATGAYVKHQNSVIKKRTDEFNRRTGSQVPYYRLVPSHDSSENADAIIQIGSKYTIETYPSALRNKIITIRQSCETFDFPHFIDRKMSNVNFNEYIWMGSRGSILKGLDIVLDYFLTEPRKILHVCGEVDQEVMSYYEPLLKGHKNIIMHGFCSLDSELMESLACRSGFVVMPSASEGCPGAVVNMMKLGCIPIVTPCAAFDGVEKYGQLIHGFTSDALREAICCIDSLCKDILMDKVQKCYEFANQNWNDENFKADFRSALTSVLKAKGLYDLNYC